MSQLDDLNTALDDLAAKQAEQFDAVDAEIAQLAAAIAAGNPVDLTAVTARVNAARDAVIASTVKLKADDPTPPAA